MIKTADNRRRFPRRLFNAPVGIIFDGKYKVVPGFEISEGGLLVQAPEAIKANSPIVVSFYVPGGRDFVTVKATVLYVKKPTAKSSGKSSIGVKFTNLQFTEKRSIRDYIADKTTIEVGWE